MRNVDQRELVRARGRGTRRAVVARATEDRLRRTSPVLVLLAAGTLGSCSADEVLEVDAVARGKVVFSTPRTSKNSLNSVACATCHVTAGPSGKRAGGSLAGVTKRSTFWAGRTRDVLDATNQCMAAFMLDPTGLERDEQRARDLYAFLLQAEGAGDVVPFTVVGDVTNVVRGDALRGEPLFTAACAPCHGAKSTGAGALPRVPPLPDDTIRGHPGYPPLDLRLQVIEKVHHGPFFGYGGSMPPFSLEVLSDQELGDILEYLGFTGE